MKEEEPLGPDMEQQERVAYLIYSYIRKTITPLERRELDQWIASSEDNVALFEELINEENIENTMHWYASLNKEKMRQRLQKRIPFVPGKRRRTFPWMAVAASLVVIVGLTAFLLLLNKKEVATPPNSIAAQNEVLPGSNKAVLTLANGKQVVLDSTASSTISEKGMAITNSGGSLAYSSGNGVAVENNYNTLTIPNGGQYHIVLADGTKVWLNAYSSLRYPIAFLGEERKVELTGEAYFEVARNPAKPFTVICAGTETKVLGTHFNINSYADEGFIKTTLIEGSVQVRIGNNTKTLSPGDQLQVNKNNTASFKLTKNADTEEATAWKDGEFVFRHTPVTSITSQLARWYNLEVEYKEVVDGHLNATIKRNLPLSKVLTYLQGTGEVHFRLEGKKLIVMK